MKSEFNESNLIKQLINLRQKDMVQGGGGGEKIYRRHRNRIDEPDCTYEFNSGERSLTTLGRGVLECYDNYEFSVGVPGGWARGGEMYVGGQERRVPPRENGRDHTRYTHTTYTCVCVHATSERTYCFWIYSRVLSIFSLGWRDLNFLLTCRIHTHIHTQCHFAQRIIFYLNMTRLCSLFY